MKREAVSRPTTTFERDRYPRTYQYGRGDRWIIGVFMAGLAAFGACILAYVPITATSTGIAGLAVGSFFVGAALWTVAAALRTRVVLSVNAIDYRGPLSSRAIACEDVRGWERAANGGRGIDIQLKPGRGRRIRLYDSVRRDALFDAWLARFPNLDAVERNASVARALGDRTLGATPAEVTARLARAASLVRIGSILAVLSVVASLFSPFGWNSSLDIAVALAFPPAAVLARVLCRGLVVLRPRRNDARPSMFAMLMLPIFGPPSLLIVRANLQVGEMLGRGLMLAALLGVLLACTKGAGTGRRLLASTGVAICLGVAFVADLGGLDVWLDRAAVQPVQVVVTTRAAVRGPAWRIGVGPTPAFPKGRAVFVSHADYAALQVGDTAYLTDHPGLLGLRWAELHRRPT